MSPQTLHDNAETEPWTLHQPRRRTEEVFLADVQAALDPESAPSLHDLLDLYERQGDWPAVMAVLVRVAADADPQIRARAFAAAGSVAFHQLGDTTRAVSFWDAALDADPTDLATFGRIDRALRVEDNAQTRVQAYHRMIARLSGHSCVSLHPGRAWLHRRLAELLHSRLNDIQGAITQLEHANRLVPPTRSERATLADLLETAGPAHWPMALTQRAAVLGRADSREDLRDEARAIHRLAWRQGDHDRAYRAADVLVTLGQAAPGERWYWEGFDQPFSLPQAALGERDLWDLTPADADPRLGGLFTTLGRCLLVAHGQTFAGFALSAPSPEDDARLQRTILWRLFARLSTALRVPMPHVVLRSKWPGTTALLGVRHGGHVRPTLIVGDGLFRLRPQREAVARLAIEAALCRPEAWVLSPSAIGSQSSLPLGVQAARTLCGYPSPQPKDRQHAKALGQMVALLDRSLLPMDKSRLAMDAAYLDPAGVDAWMRSAFFTANRAGLLLGGDLGTSLRILEPRTHGPLVLTVFDQLRDLVEFFLSDQFSSLRQVLKLPPPTAKPLRAVP